MMTRPKAVGLGTSLLGLLSLVALLPPLLIRIVRVSVVVDERRRRMITRREEETAELADSY